jgi:hypothetical protein
MIKPPRILFYDLETLQNIVATWGIFDQNVPFQNIMKERSIICGAFKFQGEKKIEVVSISDNPAAFKKDPHNDKHVVTAIHKILSSADILVAHNGDKFDLKYFNARAIFHGLNPIPPMRTIDTLKVARRHFRFNSNRLDYLGQFLGLGRKLKMGGDDWLAILGGDLKACEKMAKYNKQDVLLLEAVYNKMRPWMETHPNLSTHNEKLCCPKCQSVKFQARGVRVTQGAKYRRYQCQDCGGWMSGKENIKSKLGTLK